MDQRKKRRRGKEKGNNIVLLLPGTDKKYKRKREVRWKREGEKNHFHNLYGHFVTFMASLSLFPTPQKTQELQLSMEQR